MYHEKQFCKEVNEIFDHDDVNGGSKALSGVGRVGMVEKAEKLVVMEVTVVLGRWGSVD